MCHPENCLHDLLPPERNPPFLPDCGILLFIPFPTSEQNGTARSLLTYAEEITSDDVRCFVGVYCMSLLR